MNPVLALALLSAQPQPAPPAQVLVRVLVHRQTPDAPLLALRLPNGQRLDFTDPPKMNASYRVFERRLSWPADQLHPRSNFAINATFAGPRFRAVPLRLHRNLTSVDVYLFAPDVRRCQRTAQRAPQTEEDALLQMAYAEESLRPQGAVGCTPSSLNFWLEIWLSRADWLMARNRNYRLNMDVLADFDRAMLARRGQLSANCKQWRVRVLHNDRQLSASLPEGGPSRRIGGIGAQRARR
jgi:hypothetical protein